MFGFSAFSTEPLIRVRGVAKDYPGVHALSSIDLDFFAGEIVAICGANGAGKSTLARLLSGQERATAGEIFIAGRDRPIRSQQDAFESGILMLHQEPLIVDDFTVGENVWLYALRGGGAKPWSRQRDTNDAETCAALAAVGLRGMPTTRLGASLAPGQRQMLAVTRAIVNTHRVLILDETTASTTESYFELVKEIVAREKAAGTCVIFVSHRMQEVLGIADRVVVLRNGTLVKTLDAHATNASEITSLMIGDALRVVHRPPRITHSEAAPKLEITALCAGSANDVSFVVRAGEIVGLYGLVGSGRSSVARSMTGQMHARSGTVTAVGRRPNLANPRTALAAGIAYVSEDRRREGFVPDFTNGQNLTLNTLARHARGGVVDLRRERDAADGLVKQYGVKGVASTMTTTLSGGNQQKVCIAKWIAADPEIIVFDEPTKGIDVGARATIYEIIFGMAARGKAIVVVSSEAEEILLLTHRVLVMRDGRVVAELDSASSSTEDLARPARGRRVVNDVKSVAPAREPTARKEFVPLGARLADLYPLLILIGMLIVASLSSHAFLTRDNLSNLVSQLSVTGILVLAELLVVLAGGIDISVGSALGLASVLCAGIFGGQNVWLGLLVAIVTGSVIGAVNGTLVAYRGVAAFIVTLGMLALARGLVYAYTQGSPISPADPGFIGPGTSSFFGFPTIGLFWVATIAAMWFVLNRTIFGRRVYAVGSSSVAAESSGLPVRSTLFLVFLIAGALAGLAGFLLTSRVGAGTPSAGINYELDAIAAVVIGGARLNGGYGKVSGAVIGTLIFGIITNLLVLVNVSTFLQEAFRGALILIAVSLAAGQRSRR